MALFVNPGKDWEKNMSEEDIAQMESQGYDVTELRAKRAKSAEEEEKEEAKENGNAWILTFALLVQSVVLIAPAIVGMSIGI